MLTKGSTAMAGRSGNGNAARRESPISACGRGLTGDSSAPEWLQSHVADEAKTLARNRPDQFLLQPLSPIALRAALMRLVRVESDTTLPPQTASMRSSLVTT